MVTPPVLAETAPVPLASPARTHHEIRRETLAAFERIASGGAFVLGEELAAFERDYAVFCARAECVGVASGTDALRLALVGLGAGEGREAITVPSTFVATVEAIALAGARPVLVDIDPETRCMAPDALESAIGAATFAAVPVHLYGLPADMHAIELTCRQHRIALLEDAAQAHGATLGHRPVGSFGDAAAFSFYPTKNLGAMGDGGAIVCDDSQLAELLRSLRHHGCAPGDANRHLRVGTASRLDDLQAAVLRIKLTRLAGWNDERRRIAAFYREALDGLPVRLPPPDPAAGRQVYHLFVIELPERDRVLATLRAQGIQAGVHYPTPVHLQPGWRWLGYGPGDFPNAEALARSSLSLPLFPGMTEDEVERVVAALTLALS